VTRRRDAGLQVPSGATPGWGELPRLVALVDALYPEPCAVASVESGERHRHEDVSAMPDELLDAERLLARLRLSSLLVHGVAPSRWLRDRVALLDRTAARRRQGQTPAAPGRPGHLSMVRR
jgi:hypothetical protein